MVTFEPDWELSPEPIGDDELDVIALYTREMAERGDSWLPWAKLGEWQREAWRQEYRDH